jgi:hypothetical protein
MRNLLSRAAGAVRNFFRRRGGRSSGRGGGRGG